MRTLNTPAPVQKHTSYFSPRKVLPVFNVLTTHSTAAQVVVSPPLSGHPDALKRRQEQESWRQKQEEQRAQQRALTAAGFKWFEGPQPANMHSCSSPEEYKQLLRRADREGKLLVAKFFTEECYVCKSLHPKIKSMAVDNPDVLWVKLNGSDYNMAGMFEALGINSVPFFHMVREGQLVSELTVSLNPEKLARFRAELAAHKPTASSQPAQEAAAAAAAQQQHAMLQ